MNQYKQIALTLPLKKRPLEKNDPIPNKKIKNNNVKKEFKSFIDQSNITAHEKTYYKNIITDELAKEINQSSFKAEYNNEKSHIKRTNTLLFYLNYFKALEIGNFIDSISLDELTDPNIKKDLTLILTKNPKNNCFMLTSSWEQYIY